MGAAAGAASPKTSMARKIITLASPLRKHHYTGNLEG
jgi:hypothetical protein